MKIFSPKGFLRNFSTFNKLPPHVDWRIRGAVTDVKNQRDCGTCWIFAGLGAVEAINKIERKVLISLSAQEIVDNFGCSPASGKEVMKYIIQSKGISSNGDYPYIGCGENDPCRRWIGACKMCRHRNKMLKAANQKYGMIDGIESVPPNNEMRMLRAVATQPIVASIYTDLDSFHDYTGGIYEAEQWKERKLRGEIMKPNHEVLVVGYGTSKRRIPYWILQNSWGRKWGRKGCMLLERNSTMNEGLLSINSDCYYPIIKKP